VAVLVLIPAAWLLKRAPGSRPEPEIAATIVLSDLANGTSDASFDSTFRRSVSFELQRSTNLTVLAASRVAEVLSEMRRAPGSRVLPEIAREICQRTGSAAFIESSLANDGSGFLVALRARNCATGTWWMRNRHARPARTTY
jgi:hypothetical protein